MHKSQEELSFSCISDVASTSVNLEKTRLKKLMKMKMIIIIVMMLMMNKSQETTFF